MLTRRAFVIALILIAPLAAFAQPLSDRVPAEALIYIGWQGSESMPANFANSHAKALLDETVELESVDSHEFYVVIQERNVAGICELIDGGRAICSDRFTFQIREIEH